MDIMDYCMVESYKISVLILVNGRYYALLAKLFIFNSCSVFWVT